MQNKEASLIYALSFVCGAVVMSLEILGSRLLAPNYGNSVFVWGSLISVFLAGLSTGYYFGGKIADVKPSFRFLGMITMLSGIILMTLPAYHGPISGWIFSFGLGERGGALLDSAISFFVPSALLGAVSPFCARIMINSLHSSGRTIGTLYALATMGSIAGTLLTSFYLIALSGTCGLLMCHGGLMFLVSLPFLLSSVRFHKRDGFQEKR